MTFPIAAPAAEPRETTSRATPVAAGVAASHDVARVMRYSALGLFAAVMTMHFCWVALPPLAQGLPFFFFETQDVWSLLGAVAFLVAALSLPPLPWLDALWRRVTTPSLTPVLILVTLLFVVASLGSFLVFSDYPHVRDEVMANFDAEIFSRGHLLALVPAEWREAVPALLPRFRVLIVDNAAWASDYLPGNAAFRALIGWLFLPEVANPLLAVLAVSMTWSIAQALWPQRRDAAFVAVLLLATSTQVLFTAMTSFAMTGQLALNLVWLRLIMRNDRVGDVAAGVTAIVACGWHQVVFHPLFAAPFVADMFWRRQWPRAVGFTILYVLVGIAWVSYGQMAAAVMHVVPAPGAGSGLVRFWHVSLMLLNDLSFDAIELTALNLLRFIAWQSPLLLPLIIVSFRNFRELPRELQLGGLSLCATLVLVAVLMPFQGHGWGFRYLHGHLGVLALMAAYAWTLLVPATAREGAETTAKWDRSATVLAAACAAAMLVQIPFQIAKVRENIEPYVKASRQIADAGTDIVIVDERELFYAEDLVRNDPFLKHRPIMLSLYRLRQSDIDGLCSHGMVASIYDRHAATAAALASTLKFADAAAIEARRRALDALPCVVQMGRR